VGLPYLSAECVEVVLAQYRDSAWKESLYKKMTEDNPHYSEAITIFLDRMAESYGEECSMRVGAMLAMTYAMFDNQIEANKMNEEFG